MVGNYVIQKLFQDVDMKLFKYNQRVRVKLPGKRPFFGRYYSEYKDRPRGERRICVELECPGGRLGAGIAYLIRYVTSAMRV